MRLLEWKNQGNGDYSPSTRKQQILVCIQGDRRNDWWKPNDGQMRAIRYYFEKIRWLEGINEGPRSSFDKKIGDYTLHFVYKDIGNSRTSEIYVSGKTGIKRRVVSFPYNANAGSIRMGQLPRHGGTRRSMRVAIEGYVG